MGVSKFNNGGSLSPHRYLKHKEYFDGGLINALEFQIKNGNKLDSIIRKLKVELTNRDACIRILNYKLKILKIDKYNLNQRLKIKNEDIDTIIEDQNIKYDELDKKINDELKKVYEINIKINEENIDYKSEIEKLRRENARLKKQLGKNSTNSSLPPSIDVFKPKVVNNRAKTNGKIGGQKGHKLNKSKLVNKADLIIERSVKRAPSGAVALYDCKGNVLYYATQEIDLVIKSFITETRYYIRNNSEACPDAFLSTYKINPVSYSNSFVSKILYLNSKAIVPLERLCLVVNELSDNNIKLRPSTIINWSKKFNDKAESTLKSLETNILKSNILHVDESGWKVNGTNNWMHVLCNNNTALFKCTKTRSGYDDGMINILKDYKGYLVHDHYRPYYKHLINVQHVECNAHIIRYLKASSELEGNIGCFRLKQLFNQMLKEKNNLLQQGIHKIPVKNINEYEIKYHAIIDESLNKYFLENPNMPNKYKPDYVNLLKRLKEFSEQHLMFIKDFNVPFDNNISERMIRGIKAKKKVSGQSRTIHCANNYEAIHSINQTCNLRKMNTLKTIEAILNDKEPFNCFIYI